MPKTLFSSAFSAATAFPTLTAADLDALSVPGLADRMAAIQAHIRPKLQAIGAIAAGALSAATGVPFYAHVARHARRTVNPPADTWVALGTSPRGYKMLPHFQIGAWSTHLFVQAGVIYEAADRRPLAAAVTARPAKLALPRHFRWLTDYTNPQGRPHGDMGAADFEALADRLRHRKQADAMVGLEVPRAHLLALRPAAQERLILDTLEQLLPVWQAATGMSAEFATT